ncbi:hypothetical protein J6P92_03960 [bacterium]|nr:hypothetical protein [bacterium]
MDTDKIASTHLGKKSFGSEVYNPSLLVAVPREENRKQYGISEDRRAGGYEGRLFNDSNLSDIPQESQIDTDLTSYSPIALSPQNNHTSIPPYLQPSDMLPHPNPLPQGEGACKDSPSTDNSLPSCPPAFLPSGLPFEGFDIWHAYEFSCMTENGVPVTRLMKMKYQCDNEFLVESKSLKLYLNSFNMMKFGKNIEECLSICKKMIEKDLSELLKTTVEINFLDNNSEQVKIFADFENIMNFVDENKLQITEFKENPNILQTEETKEVKEYRLKFDSLRSNCRVTHQPDFGDVFIYYKSKKHIKEDSLVKYLTSFRFEYHFHEECCEMIFKRLSDILNEKDELMVCALYTRRGGIDICPIRWKLEGWRAESGKLKVESGKLSNFQLSTFNFQPYDIQNSINCLLNLKTLARNGIKQ